MSDEAVSAAGGPGAVRTERPVVLITGSGGLIGARLVSALTRRYHVVGMDRTPPKDESSRTDFLDCDLTEPDSVAHSMRQLGDQFGRRLASVIHLAAYYDFSGAPSPLYETLTVEGRRRLLQHLQQFNVEQFIFSSSLLVMQPVDEGETISETSPTAGAWNYPESKLRAEAVIQQEKHDIPAVVLRIAGVYDEDCHSIPIAQQISRIYQKTPESYFFPGDADHGQAFVHLDDLVDCFVKTVERRQQLEPFELLLIAEPDVMSYRELQDLIGELLHGKEWPTVRIPKALAKVGAWAKDKMASEDAPTFIKPWMIDLADMHYPVEISRARQRLVWEPKHRLRDTLDEIVRRVRQDPALWHQANGLPLPE